MSARSWRRLHAALAVTAIVTIGAVILVGTLELEIGRVILTFGNGHGIHLGDLVLTSALLPVALCLGWRLAAGGSRGPGRPIKGEKGGSTTRFPHQLST